MTRTCQAPALPEVDLFLGSAAEEAFTLGDCWALAQALQRSQGYPLVVITSDTNPEDFWVHALVRLPSGLLADITGAHGEEELLGRWGISVMHSDLLEGSVVFHEVPPEEYSQFFDEHLAFQEDPEEWAETLLEALAEEGAIP